MLERRDSEAADTALVLDGAALGLEEILLDGQVLAPDQYELTDSTLTLRNLPRRCELTTTVLIHPEANQGDEGLMGLADKLATQCESEGFRRITWFPDRPDVLALYTVTLVGDPAAYPVMLSNGHPVEEGVCPTVVAGCAGMTRFRSHRISLPWSPAILPC